MQESEILTNHQTPAVAIAIYGRQATDWLKTCIAAVAGIYFLQLLRSFGAYMCYFESYHGFRSL